MTERCHYCGTQESELRPYGPRGTWVCFECATSTPEREAQAQAAFYAQLDAAGPEVVIGEVSGPRPLRGGTN